MKDFEKKILKWIESSSMIKEKEKKVLLAVSGGPDSTALFHSLMKLKEILKLEIGVAHFNHKLRKEADEDAQFVRNLCKGIRFHYGEMLGNKPKGVSPEEWARNKRYEFLKMVAKKENYSLIATGHTLDDEVETIIMRLFRGTGIEGLSGIMPRADTIIRPLLCVWRDDVLKYLKEIKAEYRIDKTNFDTKIMRNFIRLKMIPEVERHFPNFKIAVINLWKSSLGMNGLVHLISKKVLTEKDGDFFLDLKPLRELDHFSKRWILKISLQRIFGEPPPSSRVVDSLLPLLSPGGRLVNLKKNWRAERVGEKIVFTKKERKGEDWEFDIKSEGKYEIRNWRLDVKLVFPPFKVPKDSKTCLLDMDGVDFPILVRNFRRGDRFFPLGMKNEKKLHDFFIDLKIPVQVRKEIPIFLSKGKIIWVGGLRIDERVKIKERTKKALSIKMVKI